MAAEPCNIAFIGLGTMGLPMAANMAEKLPGVKLYVFDIVKEALNTLHAKQPERAVVATSAKEAAEQADIIITMLPEGKHVRSVYLTPGTGVFEAGLSNKLITDCSTIDTKTSIEVRDELLRRYPSAAFYDAPVSGGSIDAEKGTFTFMVGASAEDPHFPHIQPLLQTMGTNIVACGGPSFGLTAKLYNNYCSALIALTTAEAYNIAIRSGMDPRVLKDVFASSTAQSCISDKWNPVPGLVSTAPASHGYQPGFKVQLMAKDLGLAADAAHEVQAALALGEAGLGTYLAAAEDPRCRDLDSRVVYRYFGGIEDWEKKMGSD